MCDCPCTVVLDYCFMNRFAPGVRDFFSRPTVGPAQPSVWLVQTWPRGEADQSPSGAELTDECGRTSTSVCRHDANRDSVTFYCFVCL